MQAKDIMNKNVITVGKDTTIKDATHLLIENRISGVPVVEDDLTVIGILSETDLMYQDKDIEVPAFLPLLGGFIMLESLKSFEHDLKKIVANKVGSIMTKPPVTVYDHTSLHRVANMMLEQGINRVPVVDDDNKLLGLITRSDLLKAFNKENL